MQRLSLVLVKTAKIWRSHQKLRMKRVLRFNWIPEIGKKALLRNRSTRSQLAGVFHFRRLVYDSADLLIHLLRYSIGSQNHRNNGWKRIWIPMTLRRKLQELWLHFKRRQSHWNQTNTSPVKPEALEHHWLRKFTSSKISESINIFSYQLINGLFYFSHYSLLSYIHSKALCFR